MLTLVSISVRHNTDLDCTKQTHLATWQVVALVVDSRTAHDAVEIKSGCVAAFCCLLREAW